MTSAKPELLDSLTQAAHVGDLDALTQRAPNASPQQRMEALILACNQGHDAAACVLIEAGLDPSSRDKWNNALTLAAQSGATEALQRILERQPALPLEDAIVGALVKHQTACLAFLVPQACSTNLNDVVDTLLDNEDSHGLDYDGVLAAVDTLIPWVDDAFQETMLKAHGEGMLPHMAARALAQQRAQDAGTSVPAQVTRRRRST